MMKSTLGLVIAAVVFTWSCSTDSTSAVERTVETVVNVTEVDGAPKTIANLGIEGMACERACGGSIKKALLKMDGVLTADIKFDADDVVNYAVIEFDEQKISSEQMVKTVSELNKGQFTIKSVAIEKQVNKSSQSSQIDKSSSGKSSSKVGEVDSRVFSLPNVLDILNVFIR